MSDKVTCSFCRRSSDEAGKMYETTDVAPGYRRQVRICLQCAAEAVEILSSAQPEQRK
jgi:hypothetical protein